MQQLGKDGNPTDATVMFIGGTIPNSDKV